MEELAGKEPLARIVENIRFVRSKERRRNCGNARDAALK